MSSRLSFSGLSIKRQLTVVSLLASGSALLLAGAAFMGYDVITFRQGMVKALAAQADIVGINSASALLFQDAAAAEQTLSALRAKPGVILAGVYDPAGKPFAVWRREGGTEPLLPHLPPGGGDDGSFARDSLVLFHPIIFDGAFIGTVCIRSDLEELRARVKRYVVIAGAVLLLALFASAAVSMELGGRVSRPLLDLARTAKAVSIDKDYSVRAAGDGGDEVGLLIGTFNEMLGRIQEQEESLRKSHDELEQRVKERTTELEAANKELEAFSYSVSHDLRAPLRSIDGFSQSILEDNGDKLDEAGKSSLQRVRRAAQRMSELIDGMLSLSHVTRQEMEWEEVDVSGLVQAALEELRQAEPARKLEAILAADLKAQGDRRLLRIVLDNLLGNALKFTSGKSPARIEVGSLVKDGAAVFYVKDNGAGFDMAHAGKLFGVFQRLHKQQEFPGTGIGLATVQRIVQRHGGKIWAESAPGTGAAFYFTLG